MSSPATPPETGWRERVEFERRLVHAGGTVYPVPYLLGWISWAETGALLVAGFVVVAALEFLRLVVGLDHAAYRALTREYESGSVAGYALYQASMTGVVLLANTSIASPATAIPAMWMLSVGDPISGALADNGPRETKRPAAVGVMFVVCVALALPFSIPAFGTRVGAAVAAVGAAGAAVADGLPPMIGEVAVDDNLTIPAAALVGMTTVVAIFGSV